MSSDQALVDIYRKQGINLVPIPKGSGKSLTIPGGWKRYQDEMYVSEIPEDQDFAVILGKVSGNLIVIDLDDCDDLEELNKIKKDVLNTTVVVRTGDGYHIYFKLSGDLPRQSNTFLHKGKYKMEIKSSGSYVIGAGCSHYDKDEKGNYYPSGKKYNLISNVTKIATIPASGDDIIKAIEELGWQRSGMQELGNGEHIIIPTIELEKGNWPSGSRYNNGFKLALRRFHSGLNYDDVLNEALRLNQTCIPPHSNYEAERWVNDAYTQFQKNLAHPDNGYFQKKEFEKASGKDEEKTPDDYADEIMEKNKFKTLKETEELLVFKNGVYLYDPECSLIKEECERIVEKCDTRTCNEVINKIKRRTYCSREDFDNDIDIINLKNGILNLKTLEFKGHNPAYLSRIQLPIDYNPNAIPYSFLKYLSQCLPRTHDLYMVMEAFASCLLKTSKFEKAFMFIGGGSNGKSTFLETMMEVLGRENISNVSIHDLTTQRFTKAELEGKLANIYADVESNELKSTGVLKALISGDSILVERKNMHPFKMRNIAKMFFSANRFPEVLDQSNAMFRRFVIIDWFVTFDKDKDINLKSRLKESNELSGILNILVRLAHNLERRGKFKYNVDINKLRKSWNERADPIRKFIEDSIVQGENYEIDKAALYEAYTKFCTEENAVLEDRSVLYAKIRSMTSMEEDQKRVGNDVLRIFRGGVLRSRLRKDKQEALYE